MNFIFSIPEYNGLAKSIAEKTKLAVGSLTLRTFPDGERYIRITEDVRGSDVIVVGGTISASATLDIFDIASGLVTEGCQSLTLVVPFYGYSTMERAVYSGEVVTAKTRARLLSAIPLAPMGNRILLLDLHSEGIPYYFEGGIKAHHLYAKSLVVQAAQSLNKSSFVLGCVDAGRAKWVESLANDMGVPAGFIYKRRSNEGTTSITGTNIDVNGRPVIIYDDMIRSGSSVLTAAQAYHDAGASSITVITTHGLFSDGGLQKLKASGLIEQVICTDSHPEAVHHGQDPFLTVISTAELFSTYLLETAR